MNIESLHKFFAISAIICFLLMLFATILPIPSRDTFQIIFFVATFVMFFAGAATRGKRKNTKTKETTISPYIQTGVCAGCLKIFAVKWLIALEEKKYCKKFFYKVKSEQSISTQDDDDVSENIDDDVSENIDDDISDDKDDCDVKIKRIREVLEENEFVRPDPGTPYPGTFDEDESYKKYIKGREMLFCLGHISEYHDYSHDFIYMDTKTKKPWYIVMRYDGGIVASSDYGGREISMDLFRKLAIAANEPINGGSNSWLTDDRCRRCVEGLSLDQIYSGNLNENISWKITDNTLHISGNGTLTEDDYLKITAPTRTQDTITYPRVLPWSVCPSIRKDKRIGEGCPVGSIPNYVKGIVVDGKVERLEEFLLASEDEIGISVNLQPVKEYTNYSSYPDSSFRYFMEVFRGIKF